MNDQTNPESTTLNASSSVKVSDRGRVSFGLVGLFGLALFVLFFLPWLSVLGVPVSGFQMAKTGGDGRLFCLVPLGALWAIFADIKGRNIRIAKLVAGIIPLLLFADAYQDLGKSIWDLMQPAWFGILGVSFVLILLPVRSETKAS